MREKRKEHMQDDMSVQVKIRIEEYHLVPLHRRGQGGPHQGLEGRVPCGVNL